MIRAYKQTRLNELKLESRADEDKREVLIGCPAGPDITTVPQWTLTAAPADCAAVNRPGFIHAWGIHNALSEGVASSTSAPVTDANLGFCKSCHPTSMTVSTRTWSADLLMHGIAIKSI